MKFSEDRSLPPGLRAHLDAERPEDREQLARVWQLLEDAGPAVEPPPAEATWAALERQLDREEAQHEALHRRRNGHAPIRPRQRHRVPRWVVAAVLTVLILVGGLWLWQRPVRVAAPPGEYAVVTLPDGSTVELNSGTTLSYHRGFAAWPFVQAERREVSLRGEAFFDVAEGRRPFVVETFNARIRVLGTRFNVRARPDASARVTRVTLAEGRVRLTTRQPRQPSGHAVTLERAGQTARVVGDADAPSAPRDTTVRRVLAWRSRGFAVTGQPLSTVLAEMERRYGISLVLRDSIPSPEPLTLYYPQPVPLETILHDICVARDLRYRATSRGYEVFLPPS